MQLWGQMNLETLDWGVTTQTGQATAPPLTLEASDNIKGTTLARKGTTLL